MNIERLLQIAASQIGVTEDAGPDEDLAGRIAAYRASVTHRDPGRDPEPWCADFVSWCFREAGVPLGPGGTGFSYCPYMGRWLEQAGLLYQVGETDPLPGDVVIFDLNLNGTPDHVGIVERVEGGDMIVIEGNYSDGCQRVRRSDYAVVWGWGRVL